MKKTVITFVIAAMVLITSIIWFMNSNPEDIGPTFLMGSGIIIMVGFAVYLGITRSKSLLRKEPVEDEMSKKLLDRASSLSYYISIYFWLFLMYISDSLTLANHSLIGIGILGMAIIFFLSWMGFKIFGFKNG